MTIVEANGGFIFGGYNPKNWVSDFMYSEAPEAYLFQIYSPLAQLDNLTAGENDTLSKALEMNIG